MTVACRCNEATELYGEEAREYIAQHLAKVGDFYECPDTGYMWELDETDPERVRVVRAGRS
jgi:hypothetical protein